MRKPPKRIPSMSKKRAAESKVYAKRKEAFLTSHDTCFCCGLEIEFRERELHHVRGRAGKLYLDERFWEMACDRCHRHIHDNPKWAMANALIGGMGEWNVCPP